MIFKELLSGIDGGRVLDVGCGTGQFTAVLVKFLKSFESVTGVDVDENSLREADQTFHGLQFKFLPVPAKVLPFPDASFDMTVISRALHHVEDPQGTLGEMHRVLRPGGYLLINEMVREVLTDAQESHLLYHHLRSEIDNARGISHNHTFRKKDLIAIGSGLRLHDMSILEYIPEKDPPESPEAMLEFTSRLDTWSGELAGHPRQNEFAAKIDQVRQRIGEYGISRPPHLVIMGRKDY